MKDFHRKIGGEQKVSAKYFDRFEMLRDGMQYT